MSIVKVKQTGNLKKTEHFFKDRDKILDYNKIEKIVIDTVEKLKQVSPYESIARHWGYEIIQQRHKIIINFINDYVNDGVNIALIVDIGHSTPSGTWVSGKHYISEPINEAYQQIIESAKEGINNL